jgi:hypothetical protein
MFPLLMPLHTDLKCLRPEIKTFSIDACDFSNNSPAQILDMDVKEGGNVQPKFQAYSNDKMKAFLVTKFIPIVPENFFTGGGLNVNEFVDRFSSHTNKSELTTSQYFAGVWKTKLKLWTIKDAVYGSISNSEGYASNTSIEHIRLLADKLIFTFRTPQGTFFEVKSSLHDSIMQAIVLGNEDNYGNITLMNKLN